MSTVRSNMPKAFFLILGFAVLAVVHAQEPLTNDSIVKMLKSGLSEDVVLSVVKSQPARYTVTPDQLIALKSAGVPDSVVTAMVGKASGAASVSGGRATGATPAVGTDAGGDPNDPMSPHDSGIYLTAKTRDGERNLTVLEQAAYQGSKTGGVLGTALTYGIKKAKMKAVIAGEHASIRTPDSQPTFYFYFEDKAAGLGKGGFGAGAVSNPNQFALIKLEIEKSSRETVIGKFGAYGGSSGTDEKSMVAFKSEKLRTGLYKVTPNTPMQPGEYCFLVGAFGAGAAGASQIFDFGVGSNE